MSDGSDHHEPATWARVIGEAADLLIELADVGLLPEEFADQARALSLDLTDIAMELRRGDGMTQPGQ